jgi:hypothetical protein
MRSVGSIGACDDDFLGGDFAERGVVERLAIATDTFPRAVKQDSYQPSVYRDFLRETLLG